MSYPTKSSTLEDGLKSKREKLKSLQENAKLPDGISTLVENRKKREEELEGYHKSWFGCMFIIEIIEHQLIQFKNDCNNCFLTTF